MMMVLLVVRHHMTFSCRVRHISLYQLQRPIPTCNNTNVTNVSQPSCNLHWILPNAAFTAEASYTPLPM